VEVDDERRQPVKSPYRIDRRVAVPVRWEVTPVLIVVAFVAGLIAGISPCILPVLPVVLMAGAASREVGESGRRAWNRPVAIVVGLVMSFSLLVLAGSELVSLLHLPQGFLRDLGVALLIAVGLGFLLPAVGQALERPFARLTGRQPSSSSGGFIIGLALGLVFVPCAGPVLAAITVLGATRHVNLLTVLITVSFALGAVVPLVFVALAGERLVSRVRSLRERAQLLRRIGGVVLIVMAIGISANTFDFLQRAVPGYTSALQKAVEGSSIVRQQLNGLKGGSAGSLGACPASATSLERCGSAPDFSGVTTWLNTPGGRPLSIARLRGKVVLVDFWTYSCINCQRTLPHVEAWNSRYAAYGLVVVGVHTPEFAFEHVVSNVRASAASLGVHYAVAIDNDYATWNAYANQYWPAEYLIDAQGIVRHVEFGEGNYPITEHLIRTLLVAAHPGLRLPPPTSLPDPTPTEATSPETYLGYSRVQYLDSGVNPVPNMPTTFHYPSSLPTASFAVSGVWTVHAEEATAGRGAALELNFQARDIYLVMGGAGTVKVSVGNGTAPTRIEVHGVPKLYTLLHSSSSSTGTLMLQFSPGVKAFDFTFG
jgi:cytochrome c biogenesis protein CcdA/thiol-disulfide isomerase/thioredoxin